jgi:hypothetical protein
MLFASTNSDLLEDLSPEKQELVAGGQLMMQMDPMSEFDNEFSQGDDFDTPRSDTRDQGFDSRHHGGRDQDGGGVRVIPIRLTGVLEVMK